MPALPLTLIERQEIRVGIAADETDGEMAQRLGRHRTTINREINRNGGRAGYCAVSAQQRADRARARPKTPKLVADPALAGEVTRRLRARDSPKRISIELAAVGVLICAETIYQAIYRPGRGLATGLGRWLHLGRRRRKRRSTKRPSTNSLGIYCSIHDRPQIATDRGEVGHLEGDLVVGAYNRSALITVFDRLSRYLWLRQIRAKTADALDDALIPLLLSIPAALRRTLTWDCGAEIAHHPTIALETGIEIYIADPKSPWQRPTNENGNALVRRYVGKGTDLNQHTQTDLDHIASRINTIPRHSLGWATAHDTYTAAVAMTN